MNWRILQHFNIPYRYSNNIRVLKCSNVGDFRSFDKFKRIESLIVIIIDRNIFTKNVRHYSKQIRYDNIQFATKY